MTKPIRIAGINASWTEDYAKLYKKALCENGFEARILNTDNGYLVAYSYRSITIDEAKEALFDILGESSHAE